MMKNLNFSKEEFELINIYKKEMNEWILIGFVCFFLAIMKLF